jgi:hypothetical protein|tara:strand:- start:324 stop:527 length:204 start_codon:yes stop_codon:yes gene_type:complete
MFKMFLVMCILANGVPECTTYYEDTKQTYPTQQVCEQAAGVKFYEMTGSFLQNDIPFESIFIGCETA